MLEQWRTKYSKKDTTDSNTTGAEIEKATERWLKKQGLIPLQCNYRCREGEIDLIMQDSEYIVFIEVRYRKQKKFGDGLESVDWRKQQKLQKAAAHYLLQYSQYNNYPCRFDVISVCPCNRAAQYSNRTAKLQWSWIKNAF